MTAVDLIMSAVDIFEVVSSNIYMMFASLIVIVCVIFAGHKILDAINNALNDREDDYSTRTQENRLEFQGLSAEERGKANSNLFS